MKVSKCRSCQAPVIWTKMESGKMMPVDANPVTGFELTEPDYAADSAGASPDPPRGVAKKVYASHFATCPNADEHRKS